MAENYGRTLFLTTQFKEFIFFERLSKLRLFEELNNRHNHRAFTFNNRHRGRFCKITIETITTPPTAIQGIPIHLNSSIHIIPCTMKTLNCTEILVSAGRTHSGIILLNWHFRFRLRSTIYYSYAKANPINISTKYCVNSTTSKGNVRKTGTCLRTTAC